MTLEKQLEWFRSEAIHQAKMNKQYQQEAENLRMKNEGLEEEKTFLQM